MSYALGQLDPETGEVKAAVKEYPKPRPSVWMRIACEPRTDLWCYHWVVKAAYANEKAAKTAILAAAKLPPDEAAAAVAEAEAAAEAARDDRKVAFGHLLLSAIGPIGTAAVFGLISGAAIGMWGKLRKQQEEILEALETK